MFLSDEELQELTGYKRKADQRRWLMERQYRFEVDALGRARVLRSHVERRLDDFDGNAARKPKLRLT